MNEQEKVLQGIVEFCQWLIPNAKKLGLEQSRSIAAISQAKTQEDIINGVNSLYQELGEEQFTTLTQTFQKSKSQAIPMNKKGAKINYLVDKFSSGNKLNYDGPKKTDILKFQNPRYMILGVPNINGVMEEVIENEGPVYSRYGRFIRNYGTPQADTVYSFRNIPANYDEWFGENRGQWYIDNGSLQGIPRNEIKDEINRNIDYYKKHAKYKTDWNSKY